MKKSNFRSVALALSIVLSLSLFATYFPLSSSAADNNPKRYTEKNPLIIVSMGDSYSAGEGILPFYGPKNGGDDYDTAAHRSTLSWPSQIEVQNGDTVIRVKDYKCDISGGNSSDDICQWYFTAVTGATTWNFEHPQEANNAAPQFDVFDKNSLKHKVDYVTLSIGGNDLGFADIVTNGAMDGLASIDPLMSNFLCPNLVQAKLDDADRKWENETKENLHNLYHNIFQKAGDDANVIVAGYPELYERNVNTWFANKRDRERIDDFVDKYCNGENGLIYNVIKEENNSRKDNKTGRMYYIDVIEEFKGHGADAKWPGNGEWINGFSAIESGPFTIDLNIGATMHPNKDGAVAYARLVNEEINRIEKEKGNNDDPLVVEIDDDQRSNFKSGNYLVNIENRIIGAKSDGIYYKENVTSEAKKISNTGNVISLLSDGETVYYVEGYDDYTDIDKRFTSKKIYKTSINDSKSEYIFSSNGQADLITCQNSCLYYLDITKSGNDYKYSLMKHKIGSSDSTKLVDEWTADMPLYWKDTAYCLGNTIFLTVNNSLCSYNISDDKYREVISASDGSICDIIDNKVCFRYSKGENYYIAMIDANSNVDTSVPISKKYDYQIVAQSGEYALFSSAMGSGEYNLYTINLKSGDIDVSEGDAGGFIGKNYFVTHDLVKPENIYFMYGVRLYDENSKSLKQMKSDEFEINITKPMWIIDGYIVDWDLNTYKIYDYAFDNSTLVSTKTITKEEAERLAHNDMGEGEYQAVYWKNVQYNGKEYFLINVSWKVDDGNGNFHYSHIGYKIVSKDGKEILNADYLNGQVQVY